MGTYIYPWQMLAGEGELITAAQVNSATTITMGRSRRGADFFERRECS